ncbi:MAG TPA: hypothetical protein DHV59_01215 [Oxalobacteraceae bacterium]|nr:hypothetical protein [Oxalobacteraceae bacterium]
MFPVALKPPFSWFLLLATINLLVIAGAIAIVQIRARRQQRQVAQLNAAIRDYFRRSGVEVNVACARLGKDQSLTAFVESEPMKRFRLSHIIEATLREQVAKNCGIHLDKIYWRFPLKEIASSEAASQKQPAAKEDADSYINEGLVYYRDLPKGDVQEVSWEKFEESTTLNPVPDSEPVPPSKTP